MKIKLSKSKWEMAGRKAGWMKTAELCPKCEEILDEHSEWEGEDSKDKGSAIVHYTCPNCDFKKKERVFE